MNCLACGVPVLELRGPHGRGMIVDEQRSADGELALLAGRLRRIVDTGQPVDLESAYIAKHQAEGLPRFFEHAPRCTHSLKPKSVHQRTTKPIRLVGR
jgi:hypothetical protein